MKWFISLIFSSLLLTFVIGNPLNQHFLKNKRVKRSVFQSEVASNDVTIKSNADAFKFLTEFGYNRCQTPSGTDSEIYQSPACQSSFELMLEYFQTSFHLPVTRELDAATLKLMNTPRCDLPDSSSLLINKTSTFWPINRTLTWKLDYDHSFYDLTKTSRQIKQSFNDWARYTKLTFHQATEQENADFNLAFQSGQHSDEYPFDGRDGTLAHAFYPWQHKRGQIHFDSTEKWTDKYNGKGHNLRIVASHEIGHILGLEHNIDNKKSIMYPFYNLILPEDMLPKEVSKLFVCSFYVGRCKLK
ncbi:unnamed protein product [Rotaria sp. Silwood1]|nr:unnamed protein product [Rotaria sp. Silwood1]